MRDFQWLNNYWKEKQYADHTDGQLQQNIKQLQKEIKHTLDLDITLLDPEASKFFKKQMKRENTFKLMTSEQEVYRRMND